MVGYESSATIEPLDSHLVEFEWALSQLYGTVRKPHSAAPEYTLYMSFYPGFLSRVLSRFDLTRCIAFVGFDLIACAACLRLCLSCRSPLYDSRGFLGRCVATAPFRATRARPSGASGMVGSSAIG